MSKEFTKSYAINRIAELNEQIVEMTDNQNQTMRYLNRIRDENNQLKQQLEEKQKTIDEINKEFVQAVHDWKALCAEKDKEIERLKVFEKAYYYNQLQTSQEDIQKFQQLANQSAVNINYIAITELEKVKELLITESKRYPIVYDITNDLVGGAIDKDKTFEIIDNQIKELKGE